MTNRQKLSIITALLLTGGLKAQMKTPVAYPQSVKINHVRTWDAKVPITDPAAMVAAPIRSVQQTTAYLDGLGRPLQTVVKKGSLPTAGSAADIIQTVLYDELGRELIKYLPAVANTVNGNTSVDDGLFKYNPFQQDSAFYKSIFPEEQYYYSQSLVEASPLNRNTKTMKPGNSWVGNNRGLSIHYFNNTTADSIVNWEYTTGTLPVANGYYPAGKLTRIDQLDEHGMAVITYTDIMGKILLKKVQIAGTANNAPATAYAGWLATNYIYDVLGNLRFVISPKAMESIAGSWSISNAIADELCFQYGYDNQNRMVTKKVPGAGVVEMVYDLRDRLVMTRDANMQANSKWLVTVYEPLLNRPTQTGLLTNSSSRETNAAAAASSISYPAVTSGFELLTETFYDDYSWVSGTGLSASLETTGLQSPDFITSYHTAPDYAEPLTVSTAVKGLVTGTKVKVLGTADTYLYALHLFDDKQRIIQTKQINITGGVDVVSTQYDWKGQPLRVLLRHQKNAANAQSHSLFTKYAYDDAGRPTGVQKRIDDKNLETISTNTYDVLGQLQKKELGNNLESLQYDYNIQGWLLGVNRNYVKEAATAFFGFELAYDQTANIISGQNYFQAQYNGNIGGTTWRSKGDGEKRKFDYSYDAANRLMKADFSQYAGGSGFTNASINFTVQMGDGSNANTAYDANGNILRMKQYGLKGGSSQVIDDLQYHYYSGSNKLLNVLDAQNDPLTKLGDFRTSLLHPYSSVKTASTEDYVYDNNGNMVKDMNKDLVAYNGTNGIVYNHLNLPSQVTVRGETADKGTIEYTYDALGTKLRKTTTEGSVVSTTLYLNGFEYKNDTLQQALHEEGRIRVSDTVMVYDYFVKDHLGNTRVVLTSERKSDAYPLASMELSTSAVENALYENIDSTRSSLPAGYPTDNYTSPNEYVAKLNASNGKKIGPAILLKVMAGDSVHIRASSWYRLNGANPGAPVSPLEDLLYSLSKNIAVTGGGKFTMQELSGALLPAGINDLLSDRSGAFVTTKPKAYLSWVLLDDQFKYIAGSSGFEQVGEDTVLTTWTKPNLPIQKNGYLYIYTGNESAVDVFFDNLQVTHVRGSLLEETHYYPFGLTMAGISSKAAGKLENRFKYNGNKLESGEFSDGSGLETYDANFRQRDVQTGIWWQLDPMMEAHPNISPYAFVNNNPILYADPLGLDTVRIFGAGSHKIQIRQGDVLSLTIQNTTSYYTYDPGNKDAVNGFVGSGVEQDDTRGGESAVTVVADKKAKGTDFAGIGMAGVGFGIEYAGGKMFSSKARTWFDTRQWKTYNQRFYGNQYTIKQSTAKYASKAFKLFGYGIGFYQQASITFNDEVSGRDKIIETGSNLYSTFGGIYGAAWGIGWEGGRMISQADWYNTNVRPKLQDFYRKLGIKIEGDPDMTWINKLSEKQ